MSDKQKLFLKQQHAEHSGQWWIMAQDCDKCQELLKNMRKEEYNMPEAQQKQAVNKYGHIMDQLAEPHLDDEGDYISYAKCSKCGAIENTDESIKDCLRDSK